MKDKYLESILKHRINALSDSEKTVFELMKEIYVLRILGALYPILLFSLSILAQYKVHGGSWVFSIFGVVAILLFLFGFTFFKWLYFGPYSDFRE
jgi:uncharacterized membrane protein YccC